ncbi:hypothetical protein GCM10027343_16250 [Noviherbaspirillum agri]
MHASWLGYDDRGHGLAEIGMRHADDSGFDHAIHLIDEGLDFLRIHVIATGNDQVLAAPDDGQVSIRIEAANIAGLEVAVGREFFGSFLRHAPVALENIRPLDLDVTDLVSCAWRAVALDDAY